jgi:BON domain-containing protein
VRSWFGDDEAQRRRVRDEREEPGRGWGERLGWSDRERGWGRSSDERRWGGGYGDEDVDRDWARRWGYMEGQPGGRGSQRDWDQERRHTNYGMYGGGGPGAGYGRGQSHSWYGGEAYPGERQGYGNERAGLGGQAWSGWQSGPYTGRGPRGYTRSDERIREDVCERMSLHGQLDASDIEVRVASGEVTLIGSVSSRYAKRMAEDVVDGVSGVREVNNQLRVTAGQEGQPGQPGQIGRGERPRAA